MEPSTNDDGIGRLLALIESIQADVRQLGHDKDAERRRLEEMIVRIGHVVSEHGETLLSFGRQISDLNDRAEGHHRLIASLTDQSASNSMLLAKHAELLTNLAEAVAGAKDKARAAMQSASDLKNTTHDFQSAVTTHISEFTRSQSAAMERLTSENDSQNAELLKQSGQLSRLEQQNSLTLMALGIEQNPDTGNPKLGPKPKLDQLSDQNRQARLAAIGSGVLLAVKIIYEVIVGTKAPPPVVVQASPAVALPAPAPARAPSVTPNP